MKPATGSSPQFKQTDNMLRCSVEPYVGILCPYADDELSEILCWGTDKTCKEWREGTTPIFKNMPRFGDVIPE